MKKTSHNGRGGVATLGRSRLETILYYDLRRYWMHRIVPHLGDAELNRVLTSDMDKFSCWPFSPEDYPCYCESSDWRHAHRGRHPRFWRYVCSGACHWLVNFALRLASLVEPDQPWRIITSTKHSTVWNGADLLFEFIYLAMDAPARSCFEAANKDGRVLPIGEYLKTGVPLNRIRWQNEPDYVEIMRRGHGQRSEEWVGRGYVSKDEHKPARHPGKTQTATKKGGRSW
jgi:hypothetical protein